MTSSIIDNIRRNVNHWYLPIIVGLFFIVAGIYIFMTPLASYLSLAILFSVIFLCSGFMEIIFAFSNKNQIKGWGWMLACGIVDFILGAFLVSSPSLSMEVLPLFVGIVLMFRSFRGIGIAFDMQSMHVKGWGSLMFFAIIGVIFSFFMISNLTFGAFTVVYWTSFTFVFLGIMSVYFGIQLRKLKSKGQQISDDLVKRYEDIQEEIKKELE